MPNALTGDFEAVLEVSGGTLDRLVASMHQNAFVDAAKPSLPHVAYFRIGDDHVDGERGSVAAQIGVPHVVLIHGATDRFRLEIGLRARYRADPGSIPLADIIHDLNALWWDLVERLQLVERPPGRDEPDWAAKIHVAVAPVYYHNYVLGHLISDQLRNHLETRVTRGPFYENEAAGRYLVEAVFGPGARENWRETVLRATGEPLSTAHFVGAIG